MLHIRQSKLFSFKFPHEFLLINFYSQSPSIPPSSYYYSTSSRSIPPFSHQQSHQHHFGQIPSTLNGLPFSRDLLPHPYFKLSVSAYSNRLVREDAAADEEHLSLPTSSFPGAATTTSFVCPPTSSTSNPSLPWNALDMSGVGLCQLSRTSPLFGVGFGFSSLAMSLTGLYLTANMIQELPPEIGLLKNLTVLHLAYNRLMVLTPAIGFCTQLKELLLQENELSTLPLTIGNLHRLRSLNLEGNPWSDPLLLSVLANIGVIGGSGAASGNIGTSASPGSSGQHPSILANRAASLVIPFLRDNAPVSTSLPPPRRWESFSSGVGMDKHADLPPITLLSWNILAEIYADPSRYGYTPSWALSWPYRQESILQTLRASGADIIALQEIEGAVFNFILEELQRLDSTNFYEGIFQPKHRLRTLSGTDAKSVPVDGVAIFWRAGRFSLEQVCPIEFCSHSLLTDTLADPTLKASIPKETYSFMEQGPSILSSCSDLFNRYMLKDNVALLARFKRLDCPVRNNTLAPSIIVGSVHLQWDESFKDVKMLQASILSHRLTQMVGSCTGSIPSIALAGDFNSAIGSGTHSIISQGKIPLDHPDWQGYSYPPFTTIGTSLKKGIPLQSAYHFDQQEAGDERISTLTDTFSGLIDYVWFSDLQVIGRLALLVNNDPSLEGLVGLPSIHFPSDHFPLMIEFIQKLSIGKDESKTQQQGKSTYKTSR